MVRLRAFLFRFALVASLAIALVATGVAHRAPAQSEAALQAYVLSGGNLADLCADSTDDGLPAHADCPACQIVATATGGNAPDLLRDAGLRAVSRILAPQENRTARTVLDPARGLRAPPLA